jgi:23S rRNA pseudouridine1911/1915/1917 synthase
MAEEVEVEVPGSLDGARIDKAIAVVFAVSRATAAGIVDAGATLDGEAVSASHRVRAGQVVRATRPEVGDGLVPEHVEFGVLYEDDKVIVVDKPAGVVVHPGSGQTSGTLAAGLVDRYPELEGVGASDRWGLVHRLDKDTSGAVLVARTPDVFEVLVSDLRARRIGRSYTALVEGRMGAPTGTIDAPLGRDPVHPTRRAVVPGGKQARTHFEVVTYYQSADVSLLEVSLETGRTHQIRVHFAAIDHPVVGDATYGATRRDIGAPRTFLHASRLVFNHPTTGREMEVESPLASDLASVLEGLS